MTDSVPMAQAQRRLAVVWIVGFCVTFTIMLVMANIGIAGRFGDRTGEVWSWFWQAMTPTLTVILGGFAYQISKGVTDAVVDRVFYRLAVLLSVLYLLTVAAAPLLSAGRGSLSLIDQGGVWQAPLSGLLGLTIGAFFGSRREQSSSK